MTDVRDDIAHLEERIETLRAAIERCRKISLAARIAAVAGLAWLALTLPGIVPFAPASFFGAIAAVLGGAVLLGSNKTTWEQTEIALHDAETTRAQLIGSISLRVVGEERPTIH
ncbi:MAG: hypothetical protein ACK4UO_06395 [Pseudolabrys sp.]